MDKSDKIFLDNYEKTLQDGLMKVVKAVNKIGDNLLSSPDIDEKWEQFITEYVADAVHEFNNYPDAAIAWPGFIGMAIAHYWDKDWLAHKDIKYKDLYGPNGWDDMDESILHYVLGLDLGSDEAIGIAQTLSSCAMATQALIRHEKIEPQTAIGFYVLSRTYTVMFRIGAAMELYRLEYKMEKLS